MGLIMYIYELSVKYRHEQTVYHYHFGTVQTDTGSGQTFM